MVPAPVFLPGESLGLRSLAGYRPWGRKESDLTERLTLLTFKSREGNHREDIKGAGVIPPREERADGGGGQGWAGADPCGRAGPCTQSPSPPELRAGGNGCEGSPNLLTTANFLAASILRNTEFLRQIRHCLWRSSAQ